MPVLHFRIKDANGEVLYPKSSFFINCTGKRMFPFCACPFIGFTFLDFCLETIISLFLCAGDVCKGDVVLFTQKVYAKYLFVLAICDLMISEFYQLSQVLHSLFCKLRI